MIIAELRPYPDQRKITMPWLPSLPAHWSIRRAKTLFREIDRRTSDGRQPLLSLRMHAGLVDHHASGGKIIPSSALVGYKRVLPGELVMNRMRAAIGLFAGATTEGLVSPDYAVFQVEPTVSLPYAVHLFRTPIMGSVFRMESRGLGTGESGFLRLYSDRFGMLPIPLPPPSEQAAIVRFLDHSNRRIDRFIRAKKKLIALLNEQKQAIIHSAVTRGLDPNVPMKDSGVLGVGEIPLHWDLLRAKQLCSAIVDCKNRTPERVDGGRFTVVRTTNVRRGQFTLRGSYPTNEKNYTIWTERGEPRVGDVFFTREAPAGEACLVPDMPGLCMGQRMMYFRPRSDVLDARFLLLSIYGPMVRSYIEYACNGSTVGHLRLGQVSSLPILWCPIAEQVRIIEHVELRSRPLDIAAMQAEQEIALVREYRTRLIADIVTGQLDVREAVKGLPVEDGDDGESVDAPDEVDEAEIDDSEQNEAA